MSRLGKSINRIVRITALFMAVLVLLAAITSMPGFPGEGGRVYAASVNLNATARVNAGPGAYMRKRASTSSDAVKLLKDNTKITIIREVFTSSNKTAADTRWYYVSRGLKKGYIRADLVDTFKYKTVDAVTTEALNYRYGAGTGMNRAGTLKKGTKVKVRLKARAAGSSDTWYRIRLGGKNYYVIGSYLSFGSKTVEADVPDIPDISLSDVSRPYALLKGEAFSLKGKISCDMDMTSVRVGVKNQNDKWVTSRKVKVNAASFDIASVDKNISFGKLKTGTFRYCIDVYAGGEWYNELDHEFKVLKSELAVKILRNPTNGGSARNVYTFNTSNCSKLFPVKGDGSIHVPQGMAYTGKKYYLVYGMDDGQAIVTYRADGTRVGSTKFPFNMGHPNAITWDPVTRLCYIFKGNQYVIYTYNPVTKQFGKAKTPYSSSGIAYDKAKKLLYASSRTGIRVYSADGKFEHLRLFARCNHGISHYVQDCGAYNDYVFHAISGADKHGVNFLDIYRASDGKYLASIKVMLGEVESAVVGDDGYVQLLVNNKPTTDYVWKTPLNINELG